MIRLPISTLEAAPLDADNLMSSLAETLPHRYNQWGEGGFANLQEDCTLPLLILAKTWIRVEDSLEGRFTELDASKSLSSWR